jgi:hypothetical protein
LLLEQRVASKRSHTTEGKRETHSTVLPAARQLTGSLGTTQKPNDTTARP